MNRPIRKKAWHRALKRGDLWLIAAYNLFKMIKIGNEFQGNRFKEIHFDKNVPQSSAYITWPFDDGRIRSTPSSMDDQEKGK